MKGVIFLVEVKRKENESFENMYRRFTRRVQQSGVLVRARKTRYYEKPKSKNMQKRGAKRRAELNEQREELKRQGKWRGPKSFKKN